MLLGCNRPLPYAEVGNFPIPKYPASLPESGLFYYREWGRSSEYCRQSGIAVNRIGLALNKLGADRRLYRSPVHIKCFMHAYYGYSSPRWLFR